MRSRLARWTAAVLGGVAVLSLTFAATALADWSPQSAGTAQYLNNVRFANTSDGWSVGAGGTIIATINGGTTWSSQTSGTSNDLCGIATVNASTAWAVGDRGTILKTTDGGATWAAETSGTTNLLLAVCFTDASTGYVVGDGGVILKTSDGGATWTPQASHQTLALSAVSFRDGLHGIAVGDLGGKVCRTTDGGAWTAVSTPATVMLYDAQDMNATHAWAVGENGTVMSSSDDGQTWNVQQTNSHYALDAVSFFNTTTGWAVGSQNDQAPFDATIIKSTDGGVTWTPEATTSTEYLYGVHAISGTSVFASGSAGTVLKDTTTGGPDTTPPVTTDDAPSGWVNHNVIVTLTATDDSSGVASTQYKIDGASSWTTYTGPFAVSGDGDHTVSYFSTDNAGNPETPETTDVKIDTTAPTATDNYAGGSSWQTGAVTLTLAGSDSGSGAVVHYTIDGGADQIYTAPLQIAADGNHTVIYHAVDGAGNAQTPVTLHVLVDQNAPATTSGSAGTGWHKGAVQVTLTGTDAGSGVASTQYKLDGASAWTTYSGPFTVSGDGSHGLVYHSTDNVGHVEGDETATVRIDTTAPTTRTTPRAPGKVRHRP